MSIESLEVPMAEAPIEAQVTTESSVTQYPDKLVSLDLIGLKTLGELIEQLQSQSTVA